MGSPRREPPADTGEGAQVAVTATAAPRAISATPARLRIPWVAAGFGAVVIALVVGVAIGPVSIAPDAVIRELLSHLPGLGVRSTLSARDAAIITDLRLPRVVLALLVGAMLSMAGASYQGVFRNPLADPYLLGAGAGAGLAVTLVIVTTSASVGGDDQIVPIAAFIGAMGAVSLAYLVGRSAGGIAVVTLVLAGVAITSFLTAVQAYLLQKKSDTLREVYTWILGRLTVARWTEVLLVLPYFVISAAVLLSHRRALDVLAVGEEEASTLGLPVRRTRITIVAAASLATAAAVAVSGLIGFVGIIVPHTIRMITGASYRVVLPLSLLFGGAFLVLADLAGRMLIEPAELPIGVVTAFLGAPFFVFVLLRSTRGGR
ncbi:MAG: iron ABC transporter permease [Actinobacteria bacterium]|nr:MAG: iron ABC transporter permease [Actinomycetota bacterium]